jgi:protein-disulfide isomerase
VLLISVASATILLAVVSLFVWLVLPSSPRLAAADLATGYSPPADFDERVRDYLLRHPEVILEAVQLMKERQSAAGAGELKTLVAAHHAEVFNDPDSPIGGNPDGAVSVVEFFDYNCPYCRKVAATMIELEASDPALRIVYKDFPILGPHSEFAARAALASRRQGKYVPFHRALMQAHGAASEDTVMEVAGKLGIDTAQLRKDLEDPGLKDIIKRNHELAAILRMTGTPSFVIGDDVHIGALDLEDFKRLVAEARHE